MDVALKQKHAPVRTVPPGEGEHHSGGGVENDEGLLRLDAEQECVQADRASLPRDECRSLRVSINLPASEILQLETGPYSGSHGCLPTKLENPP